MAGPNRQISDSVSLEWGPKVCLSNKFPGDVVQRPHFENHCLWWMNLPHYTQLWVFGDFPLSFRAYWRAQFWDPVKVLQIPDYQEEVIFYSEECCSRKPASGDTSLIPGLGRSPGEGNGSPLQYSCLGNLKDGGAWGATVHGVTKNQTWLSDWTATTKSPVVYLIPY